MKQSRILLLLSQCACQWWEPTRGLTWDIQLRGTLNLAPQNSVVDIDLFDTPAATIANLQAAGTRVICYFSAGSYENWRADGDLLLPYAGNGLAGWPGERWLDVRAPQVLDVMRTRIVLAKSKGCDGVDPDNVDGVKNLTGFLLTTEDQLAFIKSMAAIAHSNGLAIGLKNYVEQVSTLTEFIDFAVNESCADFGECGAYGPMVAAGKPVFAIDYKGPEDCPVGIQNGLDMLVKDEFLAGLKTIRCQ